MFSIVMAPGFLAYSIHRIMRRSSNRQKVYSVISKKKKMFSQFMSYLVPLVSTIKPDDSTIFRVETRLIQKNKLMDEAKIKFKKCLI